VRYPLPSLLQLIVVGLCVAAPTTRDVENLAQDRLDAQACLWAIRLHWGIENGPNWTLDTQWKEDQRAWVRQGRGLEVLGLLRSLAYNIVRLLRQRALRSAANRTMAWRRLFEVIRMALTTPGVFAEHATGFG